MNRGLNGPYGSQYFDAMIEPSRIIIGLKKIANNNM